MFLSDSGSGTKILLCKVRYSIHLFMLCATINLTFQIFCCSNRLAVIATCQTKLYPHREKYLHACVVVFVFLSNVDKVLY